MPYFRKAALHASSRIPFAAEKTLIAAANPTWPPMEFLDENKNIIGYDRDIIAAIAEEIGMKSEFRNIAWDGIFASLESGQANVIASCVTITDKRKKAYVFSDPYYEVHQAVVVAKDSAIKKPEDLKGKKVGVQIGTTAIEALRKMNVDIDLRTYDEVGLVFEDTSWSATIPSPATTPAARKATRTS